ncbi:MAG: polyphenol oxidase family protein [Treponema sp.]|nr:polyphenol oxidase family protein [Treponema sp.]
MVSLSLAGEAAQQRAMTGGRYVVMPFFRGGAPIAEGPRWGMTLRAAGSMRFRWDETNDQRTQLLAEICARTAADVPLVPVPLELIHSKKVYAVASVVDTYRKTGDGIITTNAALLPVVTVADCVPIFLYDAVQGVFGVVHSGWRGTGIVAEAIVRAEKIYGSRPRDFSIAFGPHIRECCYAVPADRAAYFRESFSAECVTARDGQFFVSLERANRAVLRRCGVPDANIVCATDCTCCETVFGSFRREAAACGARHAETADELPAFTVQAAFCGAV